MYSNSRIETFEQCPRKYRFRYIENIRTDSEGIEAFVGKRVHESLEKLYRDLKLTKLNSLEDILKFYESEWEKNWPGKGGVARGGVPPGPFFGMGPQGLGGFFPGFAPFKQGKAAGLE